MLIEATTLSTFAVERQSITVEVQNGAPSETWDTLAASRLNMRAIKRLFQQQIAVTIHTL